MKHQYLTIIALLSISSYSFAKPAEDITYTEKINKTSEERTFYNKGYQDGFEVGKREGYALAKADDKKAVTAYKNKIKGYEAGKYLSLKGKVTPPRIYQSRKNGKVEVFVKGCEIRGNLSPSDILTLPASDNGGGVRLSSSVGSASPVSSDSQLSDGVYLNGVDEKSNTPIAVPTASLKQVNAIVLRDTKFYRDLLRTSGILYTVEANGGGLRAIFKNSQERKSFVKSYNLEFGKDYQ